MQNNQLENQLDNQDENQVEKNLDKNISCNIFFEQLNLINQLPLEERGNVLYMAILNAFKNYLKNQDNQLENQLENTYISISISLSLSILSKSVLDLLNKTIVCKEYKNNWGGNRKGSGRHKKPADDVDIKLYGEYQNVNLSKEHYEKLLAMCLSEKMLNELINSFSIQIEVGKERPYTAELPNAHYERLKSYYNYRKKHPEVFRDDVDNNDAIFERLRQKWEKKDNANMGIC